MLMVKKTLFANPNLQVSLVGLILDVTRADLYQAILEGVAFGIKMLYEKSRGSQLLYCRRRWDA